MSRTLNRFLQAALCDQPSKYAPLLYKLLVLVRGYTLSLGDVKDLQKNALKTEGTRSIVDIFTSDKTSFF